MQRESLQLQQQHDEFVLRIEQDRRAAPLPMLDLRQPQEFQLFEHQQRQQQLLFNQQQLEQQELHIRQEVKLRSEAGPGARIRAEQRRFTQERQQQMRRLEWERQQLPPSYQTMSPRLQAMPR